MVFSSCMIEKKRNTALSARVPTPIDALVSCTTAVMKLTQLLCVSKSEQRSAARRGRHGRRRDVANVSITVFDYGDSAFNCTYIKAVAGTIYLAHCHRNSADGPEARLPRLLVCGRAQRRRAAGADGVNDDA